MHIVIGSSFCPRPCRISCIEPLGKVGESPWRVQSYLNALELAIFHLIKTKTDGALERRAPERIFLVRNTFKRGRNFYCYTTFVGAELIHCHRFANLFLHIGVEVPDASVANNFRSTEFLHRQDFKSGPGSTPCINPTRISICRE